MEIKEVRKRLQPLLDRFRKNENDKTFLKNEKQVCQSLIVPFIRDVLGWTTEDPSEFKAEESQSGKRIDYCVYNQGISQFIIEAKAPSRDIFDDTQAYMQALAYGYGKDHDFAILTNFRQIVILAPKIKYRVPEEAEIKKIDILTATDEDINTILMFEKQFWISKGNENPLYLKLVHHKKEIPVDERLLDDLKAWRVSLLKNIKKRNINLHFDDEKEFSHVEDEVQKFIDRLIFICFCEDKELEEPELKSLLNDKRDRYNMKPGWLLSKIQDVFEKYRIEYDSDLFDKSLANRFIIDDVELLSVLEDLREPKGKPTYDFKSIEADILGRTYENFIGHIQSGKKIKDEQEDKGKRKKEGIYYTPKYIVDYIINNTVRKMAKDKSYNDILKIKIVDPASGSGSFLIRAFDILIEESTKAKKRDLTYEEKKELMLSCIHGVDFDERAVEIAKLNLSLRLAERGKKLPVLRDNIRVGNSLIDDPAIVGYKAFNWKEEFKEIFDGGGFDIVIGNPPYVKLQTLNKNQISYFYSNYKSAIKHYDIYVLFVEKAISALKDNGLLGYILPSKFLTAEYGQGLRKIIRENNLLNSFVNFKDFQVFDSATTYTCLLFLRKSKNTTLDYYEPTGLANQKNAMPALIKMKQDSPHSDTAWTFSSKNKVNLMNKLNEFKTKISDFSEDIFQGFLTGRDKLFFIRILKREGNLVKVQNNYDSQIHTIEPDLLRKLLKGTEIKRNNIEWNNSFVIYPYEEVGGITSLIPINTLEKQYPNLLSYFKKYKKQFVSSTTQEKVDETNWYRFRRARSIAQFTHKKIITQVLAKRNSFSLDDKGEYFFVGGGNAGGFGIILKEKYSEDYPYFIGVLNSKLLEFYLKNISTPFRGGYYSYGKIFIEQFPIIFPDKKQKEIISQLAKKQIGNISRIAELKDEQTDEKVHLQKEIQKVEKEIDELVYKLYKITDEEKKIIESSVQ